MYKIAILGCENTHANSFLRQNYKKGRHTDIEVIGIYSDEEEPCRKLHEEFGVPVTFLLQYDALIDDGFIKVLKPEDTKTVEVGAWFEIPKQLVEAAGLKWRGREGFTWDWYNEVGFLVGYTQEERVLLIDEYFKKFKEIFGYYPVVVGSWHIDTFS